MIIFTFFLLLISYLLIPVAVIAFIGGIFGWYFSDHAEPIRFRQFLIGIPFTLCLLVAYRFNYRPYTVDRSNIIDGFPDGAMANENFTITIVGLILLGNIIGVISQLLEGGAVKISLLTSGLSAHYCVNAWIAYAVLEKWAGASMT